MLRLHVGRCTDQNAGVCPHVCCSMPSVMLCHCEKNKFVGARWQWLRPNTKAAVQANVDSSLRFPIVI